MVRWQIFSAVALRRLPETIPKRDAIELKVQQLFDAIEASKSHYSKHELRHIEDKRANESEETDVIIKETAQDLEDKWTKERSKFKFADHNERLSRTQYLFTQTKFGTDLRDQWLLPQTTFDRDLGDNDLLDTARRAIKDSLNIYNGFTIISKIPSSCLEMMYPKKVRSLTGFDGARVFFLKANLDLPSRDVLDAVDDLKNTKLKWFTLEEAQQSDISQTYLSGLVKGLPHEDRVDVGLVVKKASNYVASAKRLLAEAN